MPRVENPVSEAVVFPDWGEFKLAMLSDAAYLRVSKAADEFWRSKVETFFSIQGEELSEAVKLWGAMLQSCPEDKRPTAEEAARWAEIAGAADMPITFDKNGLLKQGFLNPDET